MMAKLSALGGYVLVVTRGRRQTWGWFACGVGQEGPTTWRKYIARYNTKVRTWLDPTQGSQEGPMHMLYHVPANPGFLSGRPVADVNDWTSTSFDSATVLNQGETKRVPTDRLTRPTRQPTTMCVLPVWDEDHPLLGSSSQLTTGRQPLPPPRMLCAMKLGRPMRVDRGAGGPTACGPKGNPFPPHPCISARYGRCTGLFIFEVFFFVFLFWRERAFSSPAP